MGVGPEAHLVSPRLGRLLILHVLEVGAGPCHLGLIWLLPHALAQMGGLIILHHLNGSLFDSGWNSQ